MGWTGLRERQPRPDWRLTRADIDRVSAYGYATVEYWAPDGRGSGDVISYYAAVYREDDALITESGDRLIVWELGSVARFHVES